MKKTKLFLSLASLCFSFAVLCFGVFAATSVNFTLTGQMTYYVIDAYIDVDTTIYACTSYLDFNSAYDVACALKENSINLNELNLEYYDIGSTDLSYNSLEDSYGDTWFKDIDLDGGYYGYFFVISAKNLSEVQVFMTVSATIETDNVMFVNTGIVPYISENGSKLVAALIVDDPSIGLQNIYYELTMQSGSVVESNFEFEYDSREDYYVINKKQGVDYSGPLVIPSEFSLGEVGAIGDFSFLTQVTELYIPYLQGAESINGDFSGMESLNRITYPFGCIASLLHDLKLRNNGIGTPFYQVMFNDGQKKEDNIASVPRSLVEIRLTNATVIEGDTSNRRMKTEATYDDFWGLNSLKYVYLNEGVTAIEDAFAGCLNLKGINFPSTLTSIGIDAYKHAAFVNCTSLKTVKIPSSVDHIVYGAFKNTPYLSSIDNSGIYIAIACDNPSVRWWIGVDPNITTVAKSVLSCFNSIPDNAFRNCTHLTDIGIPSSIETIGSGVFHGCTSLTEVYIPSTVTEIGAYIFAGCKSLESLTLPFLGAKNYLSQADLRQTEGDYDDEGIYDYMGTIYYLFGPTKGIDDVGMARVECGDYCYVPQSLIYLELLEGCHCVNYYAFNDDNKAMPIETFVLPSTITRIEQFAFYGNVNIVTLKCKATSVPYLHYDAFDEASVDSIFVPAGSVTAYQNDSTWSSVANIYAINN